MMKEGEAFEVLSDFLSVLEGQGLDALVTKDPSSDPGLLRLEGALKALRSGPPDNRRLAELLLSAVFAVFEPSIHAYQNALLADGAAADTTRHLALLHHQFLAVQPFAALWCSTLEVPGMATLLPVWIRFKMLQHDLLTEEEPRAKVELFCLLRRHWRATMSAIDAARSAQEAERLAADDVMRSLHDLTLSGTREVQSLLMDVVVERVQEKIDSLGEDYSQRVLADFLDWEERVIEPFLRAALPAAPEALQEPFLEESVGGWSAAVQHLLHLNLGRKRLANFWNVLVDYPDSIPALEDLRCCVQRNASGPLRQELIQTVRTLFAQRLHRAGARTEDVVEMLIKTMYALFVVFSRSEQSVVLCTVGDTLAHIGKRRDCAAAVVQSIQQLSELHHTRVSSRRSGGDPDESAAASREAPDFFRVLSTVIPAGVLVSGYREMLATQLLSKDLHDFNTAGEEEVFERLKCSMGEQIMSNCMVMLRDVATSRRLTHRLAGPGVSLIVFSRVAWPEKLKAPEAVSPPSTFIPHPRLQGEMDRLARSFHDAMPNQKLSWHLGLGRVKVHLPQMHPEKQNAVEPVPFVVSLCAASLLLHVQELGAEEANGWVTTTAVAQKLGMTVKQLDSYAGTLVPRMLRRQKDQIAVQTVFTTQSASNFAAATVEEEGTKLAPEQVMQLKKMCLAILRPVNHKSLHEIHNSLKQFASCACSLAELKTILKTLQEEGKVTTVEGGFAFKR